MSSSIADAMLIDCSKTLLKLSRKCEMGKSDSVLQGCVGIKNNSFDDELRMCNSYSDAQINDKVGVLLEKN